MTTSIYERCGGFAKVRKIVADFYDRCLDSVVIGHRFEDIDMARLIDHQARFIAYVMGGPAAYTDEHLRKMHHRLAISHEEFAEMTTLLAETLEDHAFADADIAAVLDQIRGRESSVVAEPVHT